MKALNYLLKTTLPYGGKMKEPREPYKPYPPTKPKKPEDTIEQWVPFTTVELSNYDEHSYSQFIASLDLKGRDPNKIRIQISCEVEHGYYDDVTAKASINLCELKVVKNPSLSWQLPAWERSVKSFKKEKDKYDADMKKYQEDLAAYQAALPAWEAHCKEKELKRLKKRIKQLESK